MLVVINEKCVSLLVMKNKNKMIIVTDQKIRRCYVRLEKYKADSFEFTDDEFEFLERLWPTFIVEDIYYSRNWDNPYIENLIKLGVIEIDSEGFYYIKNEKLRIQIEHLSIELNNLNYVDLAKEWAKLNEINTEMVISPDEYYKMYYFEKYKKSIYS